MPVKFSSKAYDSVIYELEKGFEYRTRESEKHVKDIVHQCAKDCNVQSSEIEDFVAVACSHVYFDTLEVCKKAVRMAIVEIMNEIERERTKVFADSLENDDT